MELKQLEAFVNVADSRSFSLAAQKLYLTQPTVSSHIASLEHELGIKLFDRTTKSLKLTEQGQRMYPYAVRMIELRDAIIRETQEDGELKISIGASTIPATYLLPDVLAEYSALNPNAKYKIRQGNSSEIEEMVIDGSVEIGLIGQETGNAILKTEYLCMDSLVLVTPVNEYYTALHDKGADISRLLEEPLILREDGSGTQQFVDRVLELTKHSKGLNIPIRSNNQEAIKRMVRSGVGVSIMSYYAAAEMEQRGMAYCYPIDISENRHFYIVYRRDRELKPEVRELIRLAHSIYA